MSLPALLRFHLPRAVVVPWAFWAAYLYFDITFFLARVKPSPAECPVLLDGVVGRRGNDKELIDSWDVQ